MPKNPEGASGRSRLPQILESNEAHILSVWMEEQLAAIGTRRGLIDERELREQSTRFLAALRLAVQSGRLDEVTGPDWASVRDLLGEISRRRATLGFTPSETALFIFSLRKPLFDISQTILDGDAAAITREVAAQTILLDRLGLYTTEVYQKNREEIIARQQQDMIELSTPVVQLWDGILALPLIGTLDSQRTQVVMETLLQRMVDTGSAIAIIDITGVPTVDTLVAQHLLKTVAAARLMGADCIISGIRPQIAQTIVHLGIALGDVATKSSLADAFALALTRRRLAVRPIAG